MWTRGSRLGALMIAISSFCALDSHAGQWVNVKHEWCDDTCSEGHDDAACLCEYNQGQSPTSQNSWNTCHGVPCCAWATVFCSVGDPDCVCTLEDGTPPERLRQWCFPDARIVTCLAPSLAGSYECSYDCSFETECAINYPSSAANWVFINATNGLQCTGENETGFWSGAAWCSFLFGTDTCTLNQQSPWDDYPLENEICE